MFDFDNKVLYFTKTVEICFCIFLGQTTENKGWMS